MSRDIVTQLTALLGNDRVLTGALVSQWEFPWNTHSTCLAKAIVLPETTAEVSDVLRCCNDAGQTVVPFGGTTNLVQGCATTSDDIALSLERLHTIESVDRSAYTMTAEAGVTMQSAQEAALAKGLYFPVDIGARDNCQLGGIVSSNAGGTKVIRYGMTRDSVLGLEAVLADGTVISSMNRYIKNNSGFDLKGLFVGSEGVLGVITRVVFRLYPAPQSQQVALLSCDSFDQVVELLNLARQRLPGTLTGFELMSDRFYSLAVQPSGRLSAPLAVGSAWYVLLESMGADPEHDLIAFERLLESALDRNLISDGIAAKSDREVEQFWAIRGEVEPFLDKSFNFDVSLQSAKVGKYLETVEAAISQSIKGVTVLGFGHLGDNNVHVSVMCEDRESVDRDAVESIVYENLVPFAGAISAEHGIGLEKRAYLPLSRTTEEIEMMRQLKQTFDPKNILNPEKVTGTVSLATAPASA